MFKGVFAVIFLKEADQEVTWVHVVDDIWMNPLIIILSNGVRNQAYLAMSQKWIYIFQKINLKINSKNDPEVFWWVLICFAFLS